MNNTTIIPHLIYTLLDYRRLIEIRLYRNVTSQDIESNLGFSSFFNQLSYLISPHNPLLDLADTASRGFPFNIPSAPIMVSLPTLCFPVRKYLRLPLQSFLDSAAIYSLSNVPYPRPFPAKLSFLRAMSVTSVLLGISSFLNRSRRQTPSIALSIAPRL